MLKRIILINQIRINFAENHYNKQYLLNADI